MKPRIVFTGGGSAGHVTPNLALIDVLKSEEWHVDYIGSKASVEQGIIQGLDLPFYAISSGKLRRYFSWKNFLTPLEISAGIIQSYFLLRRLRADVVFSKGGFVAFPVVFAAWLQQIPIVAHESDMSPGLANRLSFPFVNKICVTFAPTSPLFKKHNRVEVTGTPLRQQLFNGSREKGLLRCGFVPTKPCLLVMGGGQGANKLNLIVRESLQELNQHYQVIHLCGRGKLDTALVHNKEYCQFEYANEELPDLFAAADFVVSRAGANSLYEILALQKPHILVPLSAKVSRGDQIQNARFFNEQGISQVIDDESLTSQTLLNAISYINNDKEAIINKIKALSIQSATDTILAIIKDQLRDEYAKTV